MGSAALGQSSFEFGVFVETKLTNFAGKLLGDPARHFEDSLVEVDLFREEFGCCWSK